MRWRLGLLGALSVALLATAPAVASAQQRNCRQVLQSDARRLFNSRGQEMFYFSDPVRVLCSGGLELEADSAVMNRTTSAIQLVGHVFYRDTVRSMTADWANYVGQRDQLFARGNVVLRNVEDGSVIEGDELDYMRATDTRPESRMIVRGERPYARIPPQPDSTGQVPDTAATTEVWADRMEFEGETVFRGLGNVKLRRGEMDGAGETVVFDQAQERMTLSGTAFFETDRYRLEGEEIVAYLVNDQIRTVTADRLARVVSEELTVESEQIRIGFVDGRLDRLEAWNPRPDSVPRALADAQDFRLRADSIDARADSLGIQEVRAVGRAYGERDADSSRVRVAESISRDWIQGDTILGYFGRRPVVPRSDTLPPIRIRPGRPDDTTAARPFEEPPPRGAVREGAADSVETVLERIVVIGGSGAALSLYRMPADEPGQPPSINFLKAAKITLHMEDGDVTRVDADGPLDGVYLSPSERQGRTPEGEGPPAAGEGGAGGRPPGGGV